MKFKIANSIVIADVSYDNREKAKKLGFRWNSLTRQWQTTDPDVIQKAIEKYGCEDEKILGLISNLKSHAKEKSSVWTRLKDRIEVGEYLPYQEIRQYYPAEIKRLCHYQSGNILIYTQYEDKINDSLWQKFSAKWDKTLSCRTVSLAKIVEVVNFCQSNNFVLTAEVCAELQKFETEKEQKIAQSRAGTSDITIPAPEGRSYFPYQKAGIEYINTHPNVLLADEMGLGKTIQVIGYLNLQTACHRTVIVCPASLKINWKNELQSWLVYTADVRVVKSQEDIDQADIAIINYDIVSKFIWSRQFDLLVLDESHYCFDYNTEIITNLGNIKIGEIVEKKLNVLVLSCNFSNNVLEYKEVKNWFKRPLFLTEKLMEVTHQNGKFICTENHKIRTTTGWKEAKTLACGEKLQMVSKGVFNSSKRENNSKFLQSFLRCETHKQSTINENENIAKTYQTINENDLPSMQQDYTSQTCRSKKPQILWNKMFCYLENATTRNKGKSLHPRNFSQIFDFKQRKLQEKSQACTRNLYQNENQQSYEQSPNSREDEIKKNRTTFSSQRREWAYSRMSENTLGSNKKHLFNSNNGISNYNREDKTLLSQSAKLLQSRYSNTNQTNSNRSRWGFSQNEEKSTNRLKKDHNLTISRVENIKIHESGSQKQSATNMSNYYVYDIEVANNHNYFANNILAHNCKSSKAQRTKAVLGSKKAGFSGISATKKIYLTGTPIKNRPIELWTQIHSLDSKTWSDFWGYAKRYCNACNDGYGWNMTGASNLEELQEKLRMSVMIRRMKADVLTELPAKIRQVIELPANENKKIADKEWSAYQKYQEDLTEMKAKVEVAKISDNKEEYEQAVKKLQIGMTTIFSEIAKLRHETAVAKIPAVIEHIENIIETGGKVVVFAHHHDVVNAIQEKFGNQAVHLTGQDSIDARQKAVDDFQTNPNVLVFIGSISAAGVGITLTSASRVVFAELDWTPAQNSQAEDRCHRIGQKNSVLVQHLVLEGSLDAHIAKIVVAKQNVIDAALDKDVVIEKSMPILPVLGDEKESVIYEQKEQKAEKEYNETEKMELIEKLRIIAGMCDGARQRDHMGFNKFDTLIGCQLASQNTLSQRQAVVAECLVKKYRRQL